MPQIDRRAFLGSCTLASAGLFADGFTLPAWAQDARGLANTAAVPTASGRVRGIVRFGVSQFYGVPYAASTAGANRFMPPAKAAPWTGVRDCFVVGTRSPETLKFSTAFAVSLPQSWSSLILASAYPANGQRKLQPCCRPASRPFM